MSVSRRHSMVLADEMTIRCGLVQHTDRGLVVIRTGQRRAVQAGKFVCMYVCVCVCVSWCRLRLSYN